MEKYISGDIFYISGAAAMPLKGIQQALKILNKTLKKQEQQ